MWCCIGDYRLLSEELLLRLCWCWWGLLLPLPREESEDNWPGELLCENSWGGDTPLPIILAKSFDRARVSYSFSSSCSWRCSASITASTSASSSLVIRKGFEVWKGIGGGTMMLLSTGLYVLRLSGTLSPPWITSKASCRAAITFLSKLEVFSSSSRSRSY